MDDLLSYLELSAQITPGRAFELLQQLRPANGAETGRWLELAIRLALLLEKKSEAKRFASALLDKARKNGDVKSHALKFYPRISQNLASAGVESTQVEQALGAAPKIALPAYVRRPNRIVGLVAFRSPKDLGLWANHRASWMKLQIPWIACAAPAVDVLSGADKSHNNWLRVIRLSPTAADAENLHSLLAALHGDRELKEFEGCLMIGADCVSLAGRLPHPLMKSVAGGETTKPMAAAHASPGFMKPPYFFNRIVISKTAPLAELILKEKPEMKEADRLLSIACERAGIGAYDWRGHNAGAKASDPDKHRALKSGVLVVSGVEDAKQMDEWQGAYNKVRADEQRSQGEASAGMTIVTGFFDIRSREVAASGERCHEAKSAADYLDLARPLLAWNCNMFIVTEAKFASEIRRVRDENGLREKTVVVETTIEESDFYPCIDRIYADFAVKHVPQGFWPPKDTPLYIWSQWNKYDCLRRALDADPFKSKSFYWFDFGIYHVATPPPSVAALLRQLADAKRLRCTLLRDLRPGETRDPAQFFSRLQQAVGGGLIGGPREHARWLQTEYTREAKFSLDFFPVLDEAVLGRLVMANPDRFLPIWSGHKEMLTPRSNSLILEQMKSAKDDRRKVLDLAAEFDQSAASDAEKLRLKETVDRARGKTADGRRLLVVGLCDGGHWFKQTLMVLLRKVLNAEIGGRDDGRLLPEIDWRMDPDPKTDLDLLLFSQHFDGNRHLKYKGVKKLCVTGEMSWHNFPNAYPCDAMIASVEVKDPKVVHVPFHVTSFWERRFHKLKDLLEKPRVAPSNSQKPRFCSFLFHNCVPARERFFDALSKYKPVDALGRSKNKDPRYASKDRFTDVAGSTLYDSATLMHLPYKFCIAFEPFEKEGWVTEKIVNAMLAGAIPVYRGAPDIARFFNPRSFVDGTGKTHEEIAEMVQEVDRDEERYAKMWAQPWLTPEQAQTWLTAKPPPLLANLIQQILQ